MKAITISEFQKTVHRTIRSVAQRGEAITVLSKPGNVVLLPESVYCSMLETIYLISAPGVLQQLRNAKNAASSEYCDYNPSAEW